MFHLKMLIGLVIAFLAYSVQPAFGDMCSGLCRCTGPQGPRGPYTVACGCNEKTQELDITNAILTSISKARQFTVSDCKVVIFHRNSFAALHNLTKVSVKRVGMVKFRPGVFSNLEALNLEDIKDLQFEEKAFMGIRDVFHIDIRDTTISELPTHVMYDATGLRSIQFTNVNIWSIKNDAIKIDMKGEDSRFVMDNCTIMDIQEYGVQVTAGAVDIKDTLFRTVADHGIDLQALTEVVVTGCDFQSGLKTFTLAVSAPNINVTGNTVRYLEVGALRNIHIESRRNLQGQCWVVNNTILQLNVKKLMPSINLGSYRIEGNKVQCDCDIYNAVSLIRNDPVLENNFCIATCNATLRGLVREMSGREDCEKTSNHTSIDDAFLCSLPGVTTAMDTVHSTRQGKTWHDSTLPPHHDSHHGHYTTADPNSSAAHVSSYFQSVVLTVITLIVTVK